MFDRSFDSGARWALATALAASLCAADASAQQAQEAEYALPAQELARSLREVALRSGVGVILPSELVAGKQAPPLNGRFDAVRAWVLRSAAP